MKKKEAEVAHKNTFQDPYFLLKKKIYKQLFRVQDLAVSGISHYQ